MFSLSDANRFFLYPFPTDMRKSFDSLSGIVKNQQDRDSSRTILSHCQELLFFHYDHGSRAQKVALALFHGYKGAFEQWLINEAPKVMPKSPIGKAIAYTYNIFYRLTRYHLDGRYLPDNNLISNRL